MIMLNWIDDVFAKLLESIGEIVGSILNIIWGFLCGIIYPLISWMFSILTRLYSVDILSEGIIQEIYGRVTIILTIVMTFYIVFSFVKYTVSPDTISDKEKGAMPLFVRIILVIIMLAFVPNIFGIARDLQQRVLDANVIPRVILGTNYSDNDMAGPGREFIGDVLSAFIRVDCDTAIGSCEARQKEVEFAIQEIKTTNTLFATVGLQFQAGIEFNGLLALIFGIFMLYVVFLYCKDIALRHIQLVFLQVISPIAIISYIGPKKDGMFQKWLKQCTTTYLDLFIRMAVLHFIILICDILGKTFQMDEIHYAGDGGSVSITIYIFLIAGLLLFLKKAPKLLEELFPKSGAASIGYGFSAKDRQGPLHPLQVASSAAGTIAGVARTAKSIKSGDLLSAADKGKNGKIGRARKVATYANAMYKSAKAGFMAGKDGKKFEDIKKARIAAQETVQNYENIVDKGGTVLGHDYRGERYQDEKVKLQVQLDLLKSMNDAKGDVKTAIGEIKFRTQMDKIAATLEARGDATAGVAWGGEIKKFEKLARNYADGSIDQITYQTETQKMLDNFNNQYYAGQPDKQVRLSVSDLEIDNQEKYSSITTAMSNAKIIAQDINSHNMTYTVLEEKTLPDGTKKNVMVEKKLEMPRMNDKGQLLDKSGNVIVDAQGKPKTFADAFGDFVDASVTTKSQLESSTDTKKIMANAEGKK